MSNRIYSTLNETSEVIDFREAAPRDSKTIVLGEPLTENRIPGHFQSLLRYIMLSQIDPMFIAVPGELSGLAMAHAKYGKLPWQEIVIPAAELARDGFIVDRLFADKIKVHIRLLHTETLEHSPLLHNNFTSKEILEFD
jgi:gamma-glutamyltranspeptidase/glutathione hydrolase/leukotriene-C4 hydrolase